MRIDGKVVVITGASAGIGAACARVFRRRGARLSLTARSEARLIAAGGPGALVTAGDLTDASVRRRVVERTREHFGRIDILVNNAAVGLYAPSWQVSMPLLRRMFELNLFAALEMIQLVVPEMKERRGGAVVNVSSIAGKIPLPWLTLYSAAKAALSSLGRGLRMELKPYGIQVITICPVHVPTGFPERALAGTPPPGLARRAAMTISADRCAEKIARAVERNARTVMAPAAGWFAVALDRLAPGLVDWQLRRIAQEAATLETHAE